MARVFSEAAWKSEKIDNIQPVAWRPEYSWLYSLALADGTFEAAPKLVWSFAYACVRPDWTIAKVGKLLDELERVGLLERRTDDGKIWGRWVGSEKYLPTKERIDNCRYKKGRGDLFAAAPCSSDAAPCNSAAAPTQHGLGLGVCVDVDSDSESDKVLNCDAAKSSEKSNSKSKVKSASLKGAAATPTPTPKATPTATPKERVVLSRDEYEYMKAKPAQDAAIAEWAAEIAQREECPFCHIRHTKPFCKQAEPLAAKAGS